MADKPVIPSAQPPSAPAPKSEVAQAVADAITAALPLAVAAAVQVANPQRAAPVDRTNVCPECRQLFAACKGEHIEMVVYPADEEVARWFQGVKINGVTYLSAGPGHRITVPKENSIPGILSAFTRGEKEMMQGKTKQHHSGTLSPGGGQFIPATGGFR